jgi:hypothetical protein
MEVRVLSKHNNLGHFVILILISNGISETEAK